MKSFPLTDVQAAFREPGETPAQTSATTLDIQEDINTALLMLLFTLLNVQACAGTAERSKVAKALELAIQVMEDRHKQGLCGYIMHSALASVRAGLPVAAPHPETA